jgi:hypothetical protein
MSVTIGDDDARDLALTVLDVILWRWETPGENEELGRLVAALGYDLDRLYKQFEAEKERNPQVLPPSVYDLKVSPQ